MSFAETRQIMADIQEIMQLLNNAEIKTVKITQELPKTKDALATLSQLERVALRYLAIVNKLGLSEGVQGQIQQLSQLLVMIRMVQMSYRMLMLSTPYGWLMAAAGFTLTGLALYDMTAGYQ